MSIEDNVQRVLLALANFEKASGDPERGQHALEGEALERATSMKGATLQDAIDVLDERKLLKRHRFVGDSIGNVRLNAQGRLEAERLSGTPEAEALQPSPLKPLDVRRDILEELYKLNVDSPQATGIWHAGRDDQLSSARAREAEYLKEKGLVSGTIGAQDDLALRLTAAGRDYVEAGGFWSDPSSSDVKPSVEPSSAPAPENMLPRLEVTYGEQLGAGAFGTVWRATDALLQRDVAVKFLTSTNEAMDEEALIREARSLAKLSHPNLVSVYAAAWLRHPVRGLIAPAITMELLRGETLAKWWSRQHERDEVLRVASGLVSGVLAMHDAGLVHGDLHEENVIVLDDATAKLIDWRYQDTFLQRSSSHRRNEIAAEQRRALDRIDTLFEKQGMETERAALRGQAELAAVAATIADLLAAPRRSTTPPEGPTPPFSQERQKLENAIRRVRSSAVVIAGGVTELAGEVRSGRDPVNGEIQVGSRDDLGFQLRIPCGAGGIPILTVPYEMLRAAWVDAAGRLNVRLDMPIVWDGRELHFQHPSDGR